MQAPLESGRCPWSLRKEPACPQPDCSPRLTHGRPLATNTATEHICSRCTCGRCHRGHGTPISTSAQGHAATEWSVGVEMAGGESRPEILLREKQSWRNVEWKPPLISEAGRMKI